MTMNKLQQINHKSETEQEMKQKTINWKKQFKDYYPKDLNSLLYAIFILVYLMCAVIHFVSIGDTSMLTILLPYLSAYAGVHKVAHLLQESTKKEQQQN